MYKIKAAIVLLIIVLLVQSCEEKPVKPHDIFSMGVTLEIVDQNGNNLMNDIRLIKEPTSKVELYAVSLMEYSSSNGVRISTNPLVNPQIARMHLSRSFDEYQATPYQIIGTVVCHHIFNDANSHDIIFKGDKSSTYSNFKLTSVIFEGKEYPVAKKEDGYDYVRVVVTR